MRKMKYQSILVGGFLVTMVLWTIAGTISVEGISHMPVTSPVEPDRIYPRPIPPPPIQPEWILPTGYNDPDDAWYNEPYAYDNNEDTSAHCMITQPEWVWTPWLELTLSSPVTCTHVGFYAWYDPDHCNAIHIDVYYNDDWHHVYQGIFNDRQWTIEPMSEHTITMARVSFQVQRYGFPYYYVVADLHEFQFYGYI